jgi:hypothetical protein
VALLLLVPCEREPERARECCKQARLRKRRAVTGNAARLVRAPTLCLCMASGDGGLAARMLLVRSGSDAPWRNPRFSRETAAPCLVTMRVSQTAKVREERSDE